MKKAILFCFLILPGIPAPELLSARGLPRFLNIISVPFGHPLETCGEVKSFRLVFDPGSYAVNGAGSAVLAELAAAMKENPDCKVVVTGNAGGTKPTQQRSWDRVNTVIEYLGERFFIDRNRFIFAYTDGNDLPADVVTAVFTEYSTEGPSSVIAPHPDLRGR